MAIYGINHRREEVVRKHNLAHEAHRYQGEAPAQLRRRRPARLRNLWEQHACSHDRTRDEMGEKTHEERVVEEGAVATDFPAIDIDRV